MYRSILIFTALATTLAAAVLVACTSNSNPSPSTPVYDLGDSGGSTTDATGAVTDADVADVQIIDATGCVADSGCWSCAPVSTSTFLNQCTSSHCAPFANTRIPGYDGGALPPLN